MDRPPAAAPEAAARDLDDGIIDDDDDEGRESDASPGERNVALWCFA